MQTSDLKTLPTLFLQALLVAAAATIAIVLVTRYVAPLPLTISQTTTQKDAAFSVSGESKVTTVPDKVVVSLGITRKESDLKKAQSSANDVINTLTAKLKSLGISADDIKTSNYSISPQYDYSKANQQIIGYSVDVTLSVNLTDFDKLNQVIDEATSIGANQVGGIQFTLSDDKTKQVKQEARAKAIDDAKQNATELSRLSGVKLGRVINVVEGQQFNEPRPLMAMEKAFAANDAAAGAPTNVQPGTTSYTYTVTLEYETL